MRKLLSHIKNWSQFKWFLIIFSSTLTVVVPSAIVGSKQYVKYKLTQNSKEVTTEKILKELQQGQENLTGAVNDLQKGLKTSKKQEEEKAKKLTEFINRVDRNLEYYIKHSGEMSTQQILEAFDLGKEAGAEEQKKTIVSRQSSSIDGGEITLNTENQTSRLHL